MAMGTRKQGERQEDLWIAKADRPRTAGHPFYERLNELLEEAGFDAFAEERCRKFYAEKMGRPSLAPGGLLSAAAGGVFRGTGFGAGDGVAGGGFARPAEFFADRTR